MPRDAAWKMVCSNAAYQSPDGLAWTRLTASTTSDSDDTKPTAQFDPRLQKYVVYVRRDLPPGWKRTIGRCVTSNLSDWESGLPKGEHCPVVFAPDDEDPPLSEPLGMDLYTNAYTPYPCRSLLEGTISGFRA